MLVGFVGLRLAKQLSCKSRTTPSLAKQLPCSWLNGALTALMCQSDVLIRVCLLGHYGVDIGPATEEVFANAMAHCQTIFWNGPMGKFEVGAFNHRHCIRNGLKADSMRKLQTIGGTVGGWRLYRSKFCCQFL